MQCNGTFILNPNNDAPHSSITVNPFVDDPPDGNIQLKCSSDSEGHGVGIEMGIKLGFWVLPRLAGVEKWWI